MGAAFQSLKQHSEHLLTVLRGDSEEPLAPLLAAREALIHQFVDGIEQGDRPSPVQVTELERLEAQILVAMKENRQAVYEELMLLRVRRSAGSAYHAGPDTAAAQYLDRAI